VKPEALLAELRARGVVLAPAGDRLRYRAPRGTLTPDLRQQLLSQKAELLLMLEPLPRCRTCSELITGVGVTVISNGANHEGCAPPAEAGAS
jgi:hypothetical protein